MTAPAPRSRRDLPRTWSCWRRGLTGTLLAVVLAACGGGTSQYEAFVPDRFVAFGDDASALEADGRSWSVNGFDTNDVFDCRVQPIWIQALAGVWGFVFEQCNPGQGEVHAKTWAVPGARVADVAAQIDAQGGFGERELATFFVGTHDIIDLYLQYPARSEAELLAEAGARGELAASLINRLIGLGAKVIVVNLPDLGQSPFAVKERDAHTDIDRAALITRLTTRFNERLGVKIILDGRYVGLAQIDQRMQAIARSPISFGFLNVNTALCLDTDAPPACTTKTLVADSSVATWLWASDRFFGPAGHGQIAVLAIGRAQRNPF